MLETMLNYSIAGCSMNDCVDEFPRGVEERRGEELQNPAQARAHAYPATRTKPLVSVGAAQKGYWNFGHDAFAGIRCFAGQSRLGLYRGVDVWDHSNLTTIAAGAPLLFTTCSRLSQRKFQTR